MGITAHLADRALYRLFNSGACQYSLINGFDAGFLNRESARGGLIFRRAEFAQASASERDQFVMNLPVVFRIHGAA